MAHPLCTGTFQLGNTLGYYLNDLACASLAGAHFVAVHKTFSIVQREQLVTYRPLAATTTTATATNGADGTTAASGGGWSSDSEEDQLTFFNHLPDIIIHPNPLPPDQVKATMRKTCHCLQFCWENSEAPWLRRVPLIGQALRPAVEAYVDVAKAQQTGAANYLSRSTLSCSASSTSTLSLHVFFNPLSHTFIGHFRRC